MLCVNGTANAWYSWHMAKKSMKLGGGGRFAKLEKSIAKRGGVKDPAAVAAAVGRKKYGAKKMAKMAAAGRKRAKKGK